jgi:hypothetical protein
VCSQLFFDIKWLNIKVQNIKWLWQFMTTYLMLGIPSHYKWGGSQVGQNLVNWADVESRLEPHRSMANGSWGKNNIMVIVVSLTSIKSLYYSQFISSSMCTFLNLLVSCLQHTTTPKHVTTTYMPINSKCKLPLFWFLPIITPFFLWLNNGYFYSLLNSWQKHPLEKPCSSRSWRWQSLCKL